MTNTYPATYAKGDRRRSVTTASDAVKAQFDGFKLVSVDEVDYADLQAQAKELGIKANQSAAALTEQINAKLSDESTESTAGDKSVDTVGTVNSPSVGTTIGVAPSAMGL